ncbi:hypothetical protein [Planococcus lenghuensis]|uniref:Uncharacterized protein n=1 Tax=Planococcus lenghuensis TaxID=2213202 RepID=A0A1Q2KZ27_9BACL|nr:hypothetical protein [Planococcus lenghuensis]AQQ53458.1 hypothetical protein B0X71_10490 [Planococcus lenghuensis]
MLDHESFIQVRKEEIERRAREAWKFEPSVQHNPRFSKEFFRHLLKKKEMVPPNCGCACAPC